MTTRSEAPKSSIQNKSSLIPIASLNKSQLNNKILALNLFAALILVMIYSRSNSFTKRGAGTIRKQSNLSSRAFLAQA